MAINPSTKIFAVMGPADDQTLADLVRSEFPADHIEIRPGQWFVAAQGTAEQISNKLRITNQDPVVVKSAVVVGVAGYHGRAKTPVWEWVASKMEKPTSA